MRIERILPLCVGCFAWIGGIGIAPLGAAPVFQEYWEQGVIDTDKWNVYQGGGSVEVVMVPGQGYALKITEELQAPTTGAAVYSKLSFARDANLRVTFTWWKGPQGTFSGVHGPWVANNTQSTQVWDYLTYIVAGLEFYATGQEDVFAPDGNNARGFGWVEGGRPHPILGSNPCYQAGPRLEPSHHAAIAAASYDGVNAPQPITYRIWLGDVTGGFGEWSDDMGITWHPFRDQQQGTIIDTRGIAAGTGNPGNWGPKCDGRADNTSAGCLVVGDGETVYLGFSPGFGTAYIGDILVEDDENLIPVELSRFELE